MELEVVERDHVEGPAVGGGKDCGRCDPREQGLPPAIDTEAPSVSGIETGETVFGGWSREVVAAGACELEELVSHYSANDVSAEVVLVGLAAAVSEPAGAGRRRAHLQDSAEDILLGHGFRRSCDTR